MIGGRDGWQTDEVTVYSHVQGCLPSLFRSSYSVECPALHILLSSRKNLMG